MPGAVDSSRPTRGVHSLAALLVTLLAITATPALSAETGTPGPLRIASSDTTDVRTPSQKLRAAYWRGRYCTSPTCKSPRPGGLAHVVSFGLAAFGGAWLSRRRTD